MIIDSPVRPSGGPKRQRRHATRLKSATERRLATELRRALQTDGLSLEFQPRFALGSGAPVAVEALLRWSHRTQGLMLPRTILATAERARLTEEVGAWVLLAACRTAAAWPGPPLAVSVNIAARQMQNGVLVRQVVHALERSGLPPDRLELELPEPALGDIGEDILLALAALRDMGIGITLDDFGAGQASLNLLRTLPLSLLKLDRALVRGLPQDAGSAALVDALVQAAHKLDMRVSAEAVETEAQLGFLRDTGCDQGQGYLLGPALPAATLQEALIAGGRPKPHLAAADR